MALIGFWKCNERPVDQVTSVLDYSGHANNHDFTSVGYYKWYGHLRGQFMNGLRYSEANGDYHASVNNNADFLISGSMTISAWVRRFSTPGAQLFYVACGVGGGSELQADNYLWSLVHTPANGFGMYWEQGAGVDVTAYSPGGELDYYADKSLQHIAVVRTVSAGLADVKFYLDGTDLSSDVTGLTAPDGGGNALCEMLRSPGVSAETVHCNISHVRIYDTAESPANIAAIYAADLAEIERPGNQFGQGIEEIGNYPYISTTKHFNDYQSAEYADKTEIPTGSRIDQEDRPNSGWAQERT